MLYYLLLIPIVGVFILSSITSYECNLKILFLKKIALIISSVNLILALIIYVLFDFSHNQFQFVQEHYDLSFFDLYLGVDGISIYFVLLTTIIMPIALLSN